MEALKATLDCLRYKQNITSDVAGKLFEQPRTRAIFQALAAIFIFTTPSSDIHDNSAKDIQALEQLAALVGSLTTFPLPCKHLAVFRKELFYNYCREHHEYDVLVNKVYGLFPPTSITQRIPLLLQFDGSICSGDELGNPYWLLTRSVCSQWFDVSRDKLSKEMTLSCNILLASERLLEMTDRQTLWDSLWAILYLWLTRRFLQPHLQNAGESVKANWCVFSDQEFRRRIVELEGRVINAEDRTLFNLVRFTVYEYILGQRQNEYFKQAVQSFAQVSCNSWQHLLTLQIMKQTSSVLKHDRLVTNCEERIAQSIEKVSTSSELEYLLPHLLPENEVRSYILKRRLEFWNYGLEKNVVEDIAKIYLKDLSSFTEQQRHYVMTNLPKAYFVEEVLGYSEMEGNKKLGKAIVRTIMKSRDELASKFNMFLSLSQEQCRKDLLLFASQWDIYFDIHIGINDENSHSCFQFLTFDRRQLSDSFKQKARFPQSSAAIYYQVLQKLTDYLLTEQQPSFTISDLVFIPSFVDYFQSLSDQSRDDLWARWSDLLLDDQSILSQLMEIPVSGSEDA